MATLDSFTYTVADDFSETTATVSVTIEDGGVSFVSASPDSVETNKGVAVPINVLVNDTASADNLPLVVQPGSITTPSPSGTATLQPDGRILYSPATGFTGTATFSYTAKPSGKPTPTSTAACSVRVVDVLVGIPKYPPAATGILNVPSSTYPTIASALAAAVPGNHIVVANGTYREAIDTAKSGSAAGGYIVIRAANHLGATLAGTTTGDPRGWRFTGSYIWVTGFICNNPQKSSPDAVVGQKNYYYNSNREEYQFRLHGHHLRVTNCLINSPAGVAISAAAIVRDIDVCWNTFTMNLSPRWNQANSIYVGSFSYADPFPDRIRISRNAWKNDLEHNAIAASGAGDGRYCIYTGNNEPRDNNVGVNRTSVISENFIDIDFVSRGFYLKRTCDVIRNYVSVNRGGGTFSAFNQRHGGYSRSDGTAFPGLSDSTRGWIQGNNFANGKSVINDTDHMFLSNRFAKDCELYYGGRRTGPGGALKTPEGKNIPPGYTQAASRVIFVGCTFGTKLILGGDEGNPPNRPWKLWGDAEATDADPSQGGAILGVRNFAAGIPQPSGANLVRTTDNFGTPTSLAGAAGYQELTGSGTWTPSSFVTRAELEFSTGCDPAA